MFLIPQLAFIGSIFQRLLACFLAVYRHICWFILDHWHVFDSLLVQVLFALDVLCGLGKRLLLRHRRLLWAGGFILRLVAGVIVELLRVAGAHRIKGFLAHAVSVYLLDLLTQNRRYLFSLVIWLHLFIAVLKLADVLLGLELCLLVNIVDGAADAVICKGLFRLLSS